VFVHVHFHLALPTTNVGTSSRLAWEATFLVVAAAAICGISQCAVCKEQMHVKTQKKVNVLNRKVTAR
jgi:hypothetical protein